MLLHEWSQNRRRYQCVRTPYWTAEVESALVPHPKVAEVAVVGMPHDIVVRILVEERQ